MARWAVRPLWRIATLALIAGCNDGGSRPLADTGLERLAPGELGPPTERGVTDGRSDTLRPDWGYRGNRVRFNFIHDIDTWFEGWGVHGVYLDDCVSGISVFGNVLYRISGLGVLNGGGRDNLIENNVLARNGTGLSADSRGLTAITNTPGDSWNLLERLAADGIKYQQPPWSTAYPKLAAIPSSWAAISDPAQLWRYPQGCVFSRNIGFANGSWTKEENSGTFDKFAEIKDNLPDKDPQFVDEAALNLALKPTSPALAIPGFQPIPFAQIGLEP